MSDFNANGAETSKTCETVIDCLGGIPLIEEMDSEGVRTLARHMHLLDVGEGELLFEEGERGNFLAIVVDGDLAVIKDAASGERAIITTLSRGDSIGEMAVIDHFPRSATVIARTDATLATLESQDFEALLNDHPQVGIAMLKGIARLLSMHLRKTSSQLADHMLPLL